VSYIIAYDLGTGGIKASLFHQDGRSVADSFEPYQTYYTGALIHEQKPSDWWDGVIHSTKKLLDHSGVDALEIAGLAISGHSLGVVPVSEDGRLLKEKTPLWSDARARAQAAAFFDTYDYTKWYLMTGNGFPAELYSLFKILWYRDNEPDIYQNTYKFLGTKDYINFLLTGEMLTDHSYASGSGCYNLVEQRYDEEILSIAGVPREVLAAIVPSTHVVGEVTAQAAAATGLSAGTKVICGGVDNSCMALGAKCYQEGRVYTSLGSSAWIAVSTAKPIVDASIKPFVFAHVVPGQYASAVSIFSAGNSYRWVRDNICRNLIDRAETEGGNAYQYMEEEAAKSPIGANNLIFNPNLAGGSSFEASPDIKGGYAGLILGHTQSDLIRAALEGIAMNLGVVLELLRRMTDVSEDMILVGGGSKSALWRQIFADVYRCNILKTNIDQDAASLGAAAIAAVGLGLWDDFTAVDDLHQVKDVKKPGNADSYARYMDVFKEVSIRYAQIGDMLAKL